MTTSFSFNTSSRRQQAGMALVICLALLVLITAAVMAFFARATANRLVETSRSNRVKAEFLSKSAGDYVVGKFLSEISSPGNSTVTNVAGLPPIYSPRAASNAVPQRLLAAAIPVNNTNFNNLIRQSVPSADTNASTNSTSAAAKNGRALTASRWNAPYLLGGGGFTAAGQLPNWIYINPDGTVTNTASTNVIGRFAYNVYNEGGLLDANVAGYPSSVSGTNLAAIKNTLAGADLTQLGLSQAAIDAFVEFRNPDATSASAYTNAVRQASRDGGGLRKGTSYSHNLFSSRQDLIKYALSENPDLIPALPYLTPNVQGLTSPSYTPDPARPKVGALDNLYNVPLPTVRVTRTFTRMDGSTAKVGEPLMKRRFPLSRLTWIGKTGPANGATADQIRKAFGLRYENGGWTYVNDAGSPASTILTLDAVKNLETPREPNFFELLQAGMLYGSLGKTGGGNTVAQSNDRSTAQQVMQVGANLIDQADENSTPTRVKLGSFDFYGIENLPYLYRMFVTPYRFHGGSQPPNRENVGIWLQPEIWNPHAGAQNPSSDAPDTFRVVVTGEVAAGFRVDNTGTDLLFEPKVFPNPASSTGSGIRFTTAGADFSQPQHLRPQIGASATGLDAVSDDGLQNFIGIHVGTFAIPDSRWTGDEEEDLRYTYALVDTQTPLTFILQYMEDGRWVTYNIVGPIDSAVAKVYDGERAPGLMFTGYNPASFYSLIDPRTDRFNMTIGFTEMSPGNPLFGPNFQSGLTQRPTAEIGSQRHGGVYSWPGWIFGGPVAVGAPHQGYFGTVSDNIASSVCRYTDPDGVLRAADGAYANGTPPFGYPLATGNFDSRPVVLNRPLQTVGEMGYASRDMPWKHLDFFTKDSGDVGLLDLFCVDESSPLAEASPIPNLEAGRVDLNTRNAAILQAILTHASKSESNETISASDAQTLASSLVARTTDPARGPLVNRAELASKWAQDVNFSDRKDSAIKLRREAAIRALNDVGNTRTWNLLIDIVAQNGRVSGSAFSIEGEQRCWLHIVIDRSSGKVIAQTSEIVYE